LLIPSLIPTVLSQPGFAQNGLTGGVRVCGVSDTHSVERQTAVINTGGLRPGMRLKCEASAPAATMRV